MDKHLDDKHHRTIECEYLMVATGRRPLTKGLGLEKLGVEMDKFGRILINEKM